MKIQPGLQECRNYSEEGKYGVIPVSTEIFADTTTPIEVLRILKNVSRHVYLLESAEADKRWGRYSFLGYDPLLELTCYNGTVTIKNPLTTYTTAMDVRSCIREIIDENSRPKMEYLTSFTSGLLEKSSYANTMYSQPTVKL